MIQMKKLQYVLASLLAASVFTTAAVGRYLSLS